MELPKEYQTGLERLKQWFKDAEEETLFVIALFLTGILIVDCLKGGLLT